jgi:DNA adenine methylase
MTGPIKMHGGKNAFRGKLARWIVSLMPPHRHFVEAFAGGLAVLLAKDPEGTSEVANDRHRGLANFWRVLQGTDTCERFRRQIEAVPFSQVEWEDAGDRLSDPDPVVRAVAFFVRCRQSLAGRLDTFAPLSRTRTRRGMNEQASAWLSAIEGLPAVHARLKRVVVLNRPAVDVIRQEDGPETLFYLDPPYLHETRTAPDVYDLEMSETDHRELLETVHMCRGMVLLSGYASPMYDQALADWRRETLTLPNNSAGGQAKRRMIETLWCNF